MKPISQSEPHDELKGVPKLVTTKIGILVFFDIFSKFTRHFFLSISHLDILFLFCIL